MEQIKYKTIRSRRRTAAIQIVNGEVVVRCPYGTKDAWVQEFVNAKRDWIRKHLQAQTPVEKFTDRELAELKKQARAVITQRVSELALQLGVSYGSICVRSQRSRWGSCTTKGNLNFNCLLLLVPEDVRDYVIVHELCHRKQMNHSRQFWELVEKEIPDYKEKRRWLKTQGALLIHKL